MILTVRNIAGPDKTVAINSSATLGEMLQYTVKAVEAVSINGEFLEDDWQSYRPQKKDKVTLFLKAGNLGTIATIISLVITAITTVLSFVLRPKPPTMNTKKPEDVFGFAGITNTTQPGIPKYHNYGVRRVFPHLIGSRVEVAQDGKTTKFSALYFAGFTGGDQYELLNQIQINDADINTFPGVTWDTRVGASAQGPIAGFEGGASQVFSDGRQIPIHDTIIYTTKNPDIDRITLIFSASSISRTETKTGKFIPADIDIEIQVKLNSGGSYIFVADVHREDNTQTQVFWSYQFNLPSKNKWDVSVAGIGNTSLGGDPFLYNVQEENLSTLTYPNCALVAVFGVASSQITGFDSMRVSVLIKGKRVKVWDGFNDILMWSDKRMWVLRDMLTNPIVGIGARIPDSFFDKDAALIEQNYLDDLVTGHDGVTEARDRCNLFVNDRKSALDWIKDDILGECAGILFPSGGKLKPVVFRPRNPNLLWAYPGNIIEDEGGPVKTVIGRTENSINTVRATFADEVKNYNANTIELQDSSIGGDPITSEDFQFSSLTRESEVYRRLMEELKKRVLVRRSWSWKTAQTGQVSEPFDVDYFSYSTSDPNTRGFQGYCPRGSTVNRVLLNSQVVLVGGKTYEILVRHLKTNIVEKRVITNSAGGWYAIVPANPFNTAPAYGDIWALGEQNVSILPVFFTSLKPDKDGFYDVVASEYIPDVFTLDPLPPKSKRRFFGLSPVASPIPLRDAQIFEEVTVNKDGSIRSILVFDVTPGLVSSAGISQGADSTHITLDPSEPSVNGYFVGASISIANQDRNIIFYDGTTKIATINTPWTTIPIQTADYQVNWNLFGTFSGFKVFRSDNSTGPFNISVGSVIGTHLEIDGRGAGPGVVYFQFIPFSQNGVEGATALWIKGIVLQGDTSPPAQPHYVLISSYLKSVRLQIALYRPLAEDFAGVVVQFWRGAIATGVLIQEVRVAAPQDSASSGDMIMDLSFNLITENYGSVIWARVWTVDTSDNASGYDDTADGTLLHIPTDIGPDTGPPSVPLGLRLLTGTQIDPIDGQVKVYIDIAWNANPEADISRYEIHYGSTILPAHPTFITARIVYHPQLSIREIGVLAATDYEVQMQAIDKAGNASGFTPWLGIRTVGDTIPPNPPTNVSTLAGFSVIVVRFTPPTGNTDRDWDVIEVFRSTINDRDTAGTQPIGVARGISYTDSGLKTGVTYYYWLRARDTSGNPGPFDKTRFDGTAGTTVGIDVPDFVPSQRPITIVTSLPALPDPVNWPYGSVVLLTADLQLYRAGGADPPISWTAYTRADAMVGQIVENQIAAGQINAGHIQAHIIESRMLRTDVAVISVAAQIADAIITNAHIGNLTVDVIKAGTLQVPIRLGVGSQMFLDGINANMTVFDTTSNLTLRVAVGRLGNRPTDYGMYIFGSDGNLMYDFEGGATTRGITDNAITDYAQSLDDTVKSYTTIPGGVGIGACQTTLVVTPGNPVMIFAKCRVTPLTGGTHPYNCVLRRGATVIDSVPEITNNGKTVIVTVMDTPLGASNTYSLEISPAISAQSSDSFTIENARIFAVEIKK